MGQEGRDAEEVQDEITGPPYAQLEPTADNLRMGSTPNCLLVLYQVSGLYDVKVLDPRLAADTFPVARSDAVSSRGYTTLEPLSHM